MKTAALTASLAVLLSAACATTPASSSQQQYHVLRHIAVPGDGGWDVLTMDSASRRLFIAHSDHVDVLDVDRGVVVGEIPKTAGVHAVAIAPSAGRGFVSNGKSASVTIFDLRTLATLNEVKTTGERPDLILFDPASTRVFSFNAGSGNATAFDAATGAVAGTVSLGGKPEFAAADGRGTVFVNLEDRSEILAFDSSSLKELRRWSLAPCEEPTGLAFDVAHRRLFSACGKNILAVSDADSGHVVATVPIGGGVDGAVFDAARSLLFTSNGGDGTLSIIRQITKDKYEVVSTLPTAPGARTMTIDQKSGHLFLATAKFGPPPPPTAERPHPRPSILPGTFEIIEVAP